MGFHEWTMSEIWWNTIAAADKSSNCRPLSWNNTELLEFELLITEESRILKSNLMWTACSSRASVLMDMSCAVVKLVFWWVLENSPRKNIKKALSLLSFRITSIINLGSRRRRRHCINTFNRFPWCWGALPVDPSSLTGEPGERMGPFPFAPSERSTTSMGCSSSRTDLVKPQDLLTEASEPSTTKETKDSRDLQVKLLEKLGCNKRGKQFENSHKRLMMGFCFQVFPRFFWVKIRGKWKNWEENPGLRPLNLERRVVCLSNFARKIFWRFGVGDFSYWIRWALWIRSLKITPFHHWWRG